MDAAPRLLGISRFMRSALSALTLVACALLPQTTLAGVRFEVPDYLLRLPDAEAKEREFANFVKDLKLAAAFLQKLKAA